METYCFKLFLTGRLVFDIKISLVCLLSLMEKCIPLVKLDSYVGFTFYLGSRSLLLEQDSSHYS